MKGNEEKLIWIGEQLSTIIALAEVLEKKYSGELAQIHPGYLKSARNFIHYLAFRSVHVDVLQENLKELGLPGVSNIEPSVMKSLSSIRDLVDQLLDRRSNTKKDDHITWKKAQKLLNRNTKLLFGVKSRKRSTRIMVTLPAQAAEDPRMTRQMLKQGMNSARINCAHDDAEIWRKLIANIHRATTAQGRKCLVVMDLGGPKIRTGNILPGPQVIHVKPILDYLGNVISPAKVWIAPADISPTDGQADGIIPVTEEFAKKIKRGDFISFKDSRGKKGKIRIVRKRGLGRWGLCYDSAYLTTGTSLVLHRINQRGEEQSHIGELMPIRQSILLRPGDTLILHGEERDGENALTDEFGNTLKPAHISCTFPQILSNLKSGQPVYFDDGKIEGIITDVNGSQANIRITQGKGEGSKLQADKGINFPETDLKVNGMTEKDKGDLAFVVKYADVINMSFVNDAKDVQALLDELSQYQSSPGIILKIETRKGFENLPSILLKAMQSHPVGVMIARGDLAIETGWKNFATIQEEILRMCEAAHLPTVWATQVLDNLVRKGIPTRAEITDAAMAQRAECVMLNKGAFLIKGIKMLDRILRRMDKYQKKKQNLLPKLQGVEELSLYYKQFDEDD